MRTILIGLGLVALSGCSLLTPKNQATLVTDLGLATTCVGEVEKAAPACIAEVPSCVSLGKGVVAAPKK